MRALYLKLSYYIALFIVYGLYFDIKLNSKKCKTLRFNLLQI